MIEVQHTPSTRTVTVIATCDECGRVSMSIKREAQSDVGDAKLVIRARGWVLVGRHAICPKHESKRPSTKENAA